MICLRMQIYLFLLQTGFFTMWSLEIDSLLEPASSIHFPMGFISPSRFSVKQFYVSTQNNTCEHIEEFLMDKQSWRADVVINTFGWQVKVAGLIRVRHTGFVSGRVSGINSVWSNRATCCGGHREQPAVGFLGFFTPQPLKIDGVFSLLCWAGLTDRQTWEQSDVEVEVFLLKISDELWSTCGGKGFILQHKQ